MRRNVRNSVRNALKEIRTFRTRPECALSRARSTPLDTSRYGLDGLRALAKGNVMRDASDCMHDIRHLLARIEDKIDRTGGAMKPKPQRCSHPNCKTWTLDRYCKRHRPVGAWAVAASVRDEQKAQDGKR